jgi:uncharacterized protein (DUF1015 family)
MLNIQPFRAIRHIPICREKHCYDQTVSIYSGHYFQDLMPCYYVYQVLHESYQTTALVALIGNDQSSIKLKPHEHTIKENEELLIKEIEISHLQVNPVMLLHNFQPHITSLLNEIAKSKPDKIYSNKNILHKMWVVRSHTMQLALHAAYAKIDTLYVADGHHRLSVFRKLKSSFYMAMLISYNDIQIKGFYRRVKFTPGQNNFILEEIMKYFVMKEYKFEKAPPEDCVSLFYLGSAYSLSLKAQMIFQSSYFEWIHELLFKKVLGIKDMRVDTRLLFFPPSENAFLKVDAIDENTISIYIPPPSARELLSMMDRKTYVPPKSTYIEPKAMNGMLSCWLPI